MPEPKYPTASYVRSILNYNRRTGSLTWKPRADRENSWNARFAHKEAGWKNEVKKNNYRRIEIDGERYFVTHIIWFIVKGVWPIDEVDHKNLDEGDNKWENLRESTRSQNNHNRRTRKDSLTSIKGVGLTPNGEKWYARITTPEWGTLCLGSFDSPEEASLSYRIAAQSLHGEFVRL